MSDTLFIHACARDTSRTMELARCVLDQLGTAAEEVDLYKIALSPLDAEGMKARDAAVAAGDFSDDRFALARQFAAAKTIVIAAPYWDLMFPAVLRTYFEAITVNGLTFAYSEKGIPTGQCRAERLVYVTTAGGPIVKNFGYEYVCALATSFYGIQEVRCVSAEGLDIRGADAAAILSAAKSRVQTEGIAPAVD